MDRGLQGVRLGHSVTQERAGLLHVSHEIRVAEPALGAVLLRRVGGARGHGFGLGPPVGVESGCGPGGSGGSIVAARSCGSAKETRAAAAADDAADYASVPWRRRPPSKQRAPRRCRDEHALSVWWPLEKWLESINQFFVLESRGGSGGVKRNCGLSYFSRRSL